MEQADGGVPKKNMTEKFDGIYTNHYPANHD